MTWMGLVCFMAATLGEKPFPLNAGNLNAPARPEAPLQTLF